MILDLFFFSGLLLSISFFPLICPKIWHRWENYFLSFWGVGCGLSMIAQNGFFGFSHSLFEMLAHDYVPFMILLICVFTINSGFHIDIQTQTSALKNTMFLLVASLLSSIIGPTGSSMLFLRPLIRMNHKRKHQAHTIIFFIFTVANVGGTLTPLGDPPIFIGFLNGVDFFWPLKHLITPFLISMFMLLMTYFLLDVFLWKKEETGPKIPFKIRINGKRNIFFLLGVATLVPLSSKIFLGDMCVNGVNLSVAALLRDVCLLGCGFASYVFTDRNIHRQNHFSFAPMAEVGRVFLAIFTTMIPLTKSLQLGAQGPFAPLFECVKKGPAAYFWLSGCLSAFLDNAPTYLLFFRLAGNDAKMLMSEGVTLQAISIGTVIFGAMTYIGNAPNLMIRAIAKQSQITMPSFWGYVGWSCAVLLPVLYVLSALLF